jgi:hypothetical protein
VTGVNTNLNFEEDWKTHYSKPMSDIREEGEEEMVGTIGCEENITKEGLNCVFIKNKK